MKPTTDKLIDKLLQALGKAGYDSGKVLDPDAWWPLNYLMYQSLFFTDYYQDLITNYEQAKKRYSLKRIADIYKYPTAIWLSLVNLPSTMKKLGYDKQKRIKVTLDFIKMLQMRMAGSVFCEDGRNIVWDKKRVNRLIKRVEWINVQDNPELLFLFGRLHANLVSLNEAIYWNANCSTREVHGPYEVKYKGKKAQLVVREFYDLHASDIEPLIKDFPYFSCRTYTLYDPRIIFDFPVLNDYTHNTPLSVHTVAVYGEVQTSKTLKTLKTIRELKEVCKNFEEKGAKISSKVEVMGRKQQVLESVLRVYYRTRKIKELLGKDWKPPKELTQKIKMSLRSFPEPTWQELTRKQYLNLIDPRIDAKFP